MLSRRRLELLGHNGSAAERGHIRQQDRIVQFVEVVTRDRGGSTEICCSEGMTIMDESPALQCIKHAPIGQGKK